jgi:hypothetical protein
MGLGRWKLTQRAFSNILSIQLGLLFAIINTSYTKVSLVRNTWSGEGRWRLAGACRRLVFSPITSFLIVVKDG